MRLSNKFEQSLVLLVVSLVFLFISCIVSVISKTTYAESEDGPISALTEYFVNIFDGSDRLTVKVRSSATVGDVIRKSGISLNQGDIVEPALDTAIDADNYFINIHRARPAVVRDGKKDVYVLTASYDLKTIARSAGIEVYDGDEVVPAVNTLFLEMGMVEVYDVIRHGGTKITEEIEIPYEEQRVKDYNVAPGKEEVRQLGEMGIKIKTFEVFYVDGKEAERKLIKEEVKKNPVTKIVAVGASAIERSPLTRSKGRNRYTVTKPNGRVVERQETYYDLPMSRVMQNAASMCGVKAYYTVRADGAKVDADGYVLVAANLDYYPRCSIVETSLGLGKVYDTGSFAAANPEQFDIATDWTNRNGV